MVSQVEEHGDEQEHMVMMACNGQDVDVDEDLFVANISSYNVSVQASSCKDMNRENNSTMEESNIKEEMKEENFLFKKEIGNDIFDSAFNLNIDGVLEKLLNAARDVRTKKVVDKTDFRDRLGKNIMILDNVSAKYTEHNWPRDDKLDQIDAIKGLLVDTLDNLKSDDISHIIDFLNTRKRVVIDRDSENQLLFADLLNLGIQLYDIVNKTKCNGYLGMVQVKVKLRDGLATSDLDNLKQLANNDVIIDGEYLIFWSLLDNGASVSCFHEGLRPYLSYIHECFVNEKITGVTGTKLLETEHGMIDLFVRFFCLY